MEEKERFEVFGKNHIKNLKEKNNGRFKTRRLFGSFEVNAE